MTSPRTPPTFLFHTADDQAVPVENSLQFAAACRKAGVPVELHVFEHGRHGVGLATSDPVLSAWTTLWSSLGLTGEDDEADPLETFEVEDQSSLPASPADRLEQSQVMAIIEEAVQSLPERQRQAFLLRYWEDFDVSETAKAMGCSEGSVKTHCSRAVHALAKLLRSKGVTL